MSKDFITALNCEIANVLDPIDPQLVAQRADVDMTKLRKRVMRMDDFAVVYMHAYDYMEVNPRVHPLRAFMHAVECECVVRVLNGGPIRDDEFMQLVVAWRQLCKTDKV